MTLYICFLLYEHEAYRENVFGWVVTPLSSCVYYSVTLYPEVIIGGPRPEPGWVLGNDVHEIFRNAECGMSILKLSLNNLMEMENC